MSNNLIASIAVFAELCETEKDLKDILKEFIKSIFDIESIRSLNVSETRIKLKRHFDFDLPEAVIKTCLNSLKKDGYLTRDDKRYILSKTDIVTKDVTGKIESKRNQFDKIENDLQIYYEKYLERDLKKEETQKLSKEFINYLMDDGVSDNYAAIISSFVLDFSTSEEFVKQLNKAKEGLVLLTGLKYTNDITRVGRWKKDLTFYLDTEHLFNCVGFNGELYQKLFNDFFELINEINSQNRVKNGNDIIHLKYFEEVKKEVDGFFFVAEKIVKGKENLSPENTAMEEICKGCSSVSDVVRKKSEFETYLKTMGIRVEDEIDYLEEPEYNIVDQSLINKYSNKKRPYSEDEILNVLRSFSVINYLRKGKSRVRFEDCKYIILTGKYFTRKLSRDLEVKNQKKDIPFATDIYFVTNRLWFTLNKGFSNSGFVPVSLNVVSKAQLALSSLRNFSIQNKYTELKKELIEGKIDNEQAQEYYYGLREKAKKPEDLSKELVGESLDIIFENDFERHIREKSNLKEELSYVKDSNKELVEFKRKVERENREPLKSRTRLIYAALLTVCIILYFFIVTSTGYLFYSISDGSNFSKRVISTILSLAPFLVTIYPIWKYWGSLQKLISRFSKRSYKRFIRKIDD